MFIELTRVTYNSSLGVYEIHDKLLINTNDIIEISKSPARNNDYSSVLINGYSLTCLESYDYIRSLLLCSDKIVGRSLDE